MTKPDYICAANNNFANFTIRQRFPNIINKIIKQNHPDREAVCQLQRLVKYAEHMHIKELTGNKGDYVIWNELIQMHQSSWYEEPFMFVEFYFYRRIIEALDYFSSGTDPYEAEKKLSLSLNESKIVFLAEVIEKNAKNILAELVINCLWGNLDDLSQIRRIKYSEKPLENILINDIELLQDHLSKKIHQIDIILDNAGFELCMDLLFCYYILTNDIADKVYIHVKKYPIFVSDTTQDDINITLSFLNSSQSEVLRDIGKQLRMYFDSGDIVAVSNPFWTLPIAYTDLSTELLDHFKNSDLVILKGDLNYRRLVEDRLWDISTDIKDVAQYFPSDILILRALKSELMLGLPITIVENLYRTDKNWLIDGNYGMIQFVAHETTGGLSEE